MHKACFIARGARRKVLLSKLKSTLYFYGLILAHKLVWGRDSFAISFRVNGDGSFLAIGYNPPFFVVAGRIPNWREVITSIRQILRYNTAAFQSVDCSRLYQRVVLASSISQMAARRTSVRGDARSSMRMRAALTRVYILSP